MERLAELEKQLEVIQDRVMDLQSIADSFEVYRRELELKRIADAELKAEEELMMGTHGGPSVTVGHGTMGSTLRGPSGVR